MKALFEIRSSVLNERIRYHFAPAWSPMRQESQNILIQLIRTAVACENSMRIRESKPCRLLLTGLMRSSLVGVLAVVLFVPEAFAADKLYAIYTAHSLSHVY